MVSQNNRKSFWRVNVLNAPDDFIDWLERWFWRDCLKRWFERLLKRFGWRLFEEVVWKMRIWENSLKSVLKRMLWKECFKRNFLEVDLKLRKMRAKNNIEWDCSIVLRECLETIAENGCLWVSRIVVLTVFWNSIANNRSKIVCYKLLSKVIFWNHSWQWIAKNNLFK